MHKKLHRVGFVVYDSNGNNHSFFKNIVDCITSKQSGGEKSIQNFFDSLAACRVHVVVGNSAGLNIKNMEEDIK